jgi:hypothetical protein
MRDTPDQQISLTDPRCAVHGDQRIFAMWDAPAQFHRFRWD